MTERLLPPLDLDALEGAPLPATLKGLAARAVGRPLRELGALGLSLLEGDLPLPAAVLKDSALRHNATWMHAFAERASASLCPHGKTTMAPQLFERQLAEGAWGITAATACHVRTYRQFGVQRILLANQLVDRANLELVLDELRADPSFDFYCLIDSIANLEWLVEALQQRPIHRPLQVLLEVGTSGGRTGVRSLEDGIYLGRALRDAAPWIALRGVEAFEGIAGGDDDAQVELVVHTMLDSVAALARQGFAEGWFARGEVLLSAGGSAYFDMATAVLQAAGTTQLVRVVLRSGCYLTQDTLYYGRLQARLSQRAGPSLWGHGPGLRNALEVWAPVQSVPEPTRAICAFGKRDMSYDMALPQPVWWFRRGLHTAPHPASAEWQVVKLNDQHAWLDVPAAGMPLEPGDLLGFGVAHPCTTFDKWPLLQLVDDDYRVTGGVRTFF
jgi:D-serine dehydratase